ncbi:free fatty acid receptor 1-like [Alligator mississippiensis]|uniref:Free fatty acid receptor 1-like n=1 Tax=Alligator mississippiensis TaxID=8496 RepID=A0A151MUN5_ALLMI|nr:free fatty acid receptor 1-like [Alligator mississippiensis]
MPTPDWLGLCVNAGAAALGLPAAGAALFHLARLPPSPSRIYRLHLLLADLALGLCLPLRALEAAWPGWAPPGPLCPLATLGHLGSLYAAACFSAALSAGRCLGAVYPLLYRRYRQPRYSCFICGGLWGVVGAHGLALVALETPSTSNGTLASVCPSVPRLGLRLELSMLLYFMPLVLAAFCTAGCLQALARSRLGWRRKLRAARVALASLALLLVASGPHNVAHVVGFAQGQDVAWHHLALLPAAATAVLDPLLGLAAEGRGARSCSGGGLSVVFHPRAGCIRGG